MESVSKSNIDKNFGKILREFRKKKKLTQEQLAEKAKCSTSYIKQIESQRNFKNVSFITILNISEALGIDIADLFKKD